MPVERCQRKGEKGWRWGKQGKCYIKSEEGSDEAAREKAEKQGRAIESRRKNAVSYSFQGTRLTIQITLHSPRLTKKSVTPCD